MSSFFTTQQAAALAGQTVRMAWLAEFQFVSATKRIWSGDTLLAITTAALTTGEDPCRSLVLGSLGAAIQASTMGNAPITHEQLVSMIRRTLAPRTGSQQEIKPLPETPPAWT